MGIIFNEGNMATIREVAERAGVSAASVSRILSGDSTYKVLPETRDRVLQAVKELGYAPNPNYRRKFSEYVTIGCISRMTVENTQDRYYHTILKGAQNFLKRQNLDIDFVLSQFDIMNEASLSSLLAHPPKGLILMDRPDERTMELLSSKIKHIVGIDTGNPSIDNVCYDRYEAGCLAMRYLISKGHERIAYIGAHISANILNFGRYEAYRRMMKKAGLAVNPRWIIDCEWHRSVCFEKTVTLMKSAENRPTALFVSSDHMAMAAMSALYSLGISVPDEISIIGISDIEDVKYLSPPLTTISVPQVAIGEIAADALLRRINGDKSIPKKITVPIKLVERSSVKDISIQTESPESD